MELAPIISTLFVSLPALVPIVPAPVTNLAPLEMISELFALRLPTFITEVGPPFVHNVLGPAITSLPTPVAVSPIFVVLLRTVPFLTSIVPAPEHPIFMKPDPAFMPVTTSEPLIIRTLPVVFGA
jgi:hypothetical protein